jgi:signal transduction histidine kinase
VLSKSDEQKVVVSIKDTCSGIDSSIVNHLFSKFITKSKGGTGLGLDISKNIIEAHGGNMWAKKNKDGKGSTFSLNLPLLL